MKHKYVIPLCGGETYHIFNRGINRMPIFFSEENKRYFLDQFFTRIAKVATIYSYCLLQNHFHFLVRINDDPCEGLERKSVHQHFSNFFNAYAKAINKQEDRTGSLFQRPFRRVLVESEEQFLRLIFYIHANPQKHGICEDFREYHFSSFHDLKSIGSPSLLDKAFVWQSFGGIENFREHHNIGQRILAW